MRIVSGAEAIILPIVASHWYRSVRDRATGSSSGSTTAVPARHAPFYRKGLTIRASREPTTYRPNAARTAAAVELKYSGGSMKPHSLNLEPLARARR
jgi:hypothetical protein